LSGVVIPPNSSFQSIGMTNEQQEVTQKYKSTTVIEMMELIENHGAEEIRDDKITFQNESS